MLARTRAAAAHSAGAMERLAVNDHVRAGAVLLQRGTCRMLIHDSFRLPSRPRVPIAAHFTAQSSGIAYLALHPGA